MRDDYDIIDKILEEIDLDQVPVEFIVAAKVEYEEGTMKLISSTDLMKLVQNDLTLEEQGIKEIHLLLNIELIKKQVNSIVTGIMAKVME